MSHVRSSSGQLSSKPIIIKPCNASSNPGRPRDLEGPWEDKGPALGEEKASVQRGLVAGVHPRSWVGGPGGDGVLRPGWGHMVFAPAR